MTTKTIHRGLHVTAGALALLVAAIVAFGVIPDVRTDPTTRGTAVPALWVIVIGNVLVSTAVFSGAFMASSGRRRLLLGSAATLAFLLGFAFLDAAFTPEGLARDAATRRILLCVLADLAAGAFILLVAVLRPFSPYVKREQEIQEITETARMLALDRPGTTIEDNWDEAVEMCNRTYFYPDAPGEPTTKSPGKEDVGAENADLASTRSG